MTLSVLIVLITILCILYGFMRYYEWIEIKSYYEDLSYNMDLAQVYKEYKKKVKKCPSLKKDIKVIEQILKDN